VKESVVGPTVRSSEVPSAASRARTASGLPVTPLLAVSASVPDPEAVRARLAALGTSLDLTVGPTTLSFTVDTPNGPVVFG
jgi:hypothetical protein